MENLAPYASLTSTSRGRAYPEDSPVYRNHYQRDRDRIIHSAAFRRLEYKTQVFVNHEGDLFRTRLTHSLEVAQIARSIARELRLHEDLAEAIALSHDLGHTPFGHAGQTALNRCMKEFGGFEHNLQSLRVVDVLEQKYADFPGLNLMFETREGILKHCAVRDAEALGDVGRRFIDRTHPSLEAQLVDLSDETAYSNHDVDDGIRYGLISIEELMGIELFRKQHERVVKKYSNLNERCLVHEVIRRMINVMVVDLIDTSRGNIENAAPRSIEDVRHNPAPMMAFSGEMRALTLELKQYLRRHLYQHYRVHRMTKKAQDIIEGLFGAFMNDARIMPPEARQLLDRTDNPNDDSNIARAVADYIAGMTDRYAIVEYERIFNPKEFSLA